MDKLLITGVSGFVGKHFLDYLERNKIRAQVLGIDRVPSGSSPAYSCLDLTIKHVDLLVGKSLERLLFEFQPDYIVHLASYSSVAFSWKEPVLSFQNNMNVFLNLVDTVRKLGICPRILSVGSSECYGNVTADHLPLVESGQLDPISPYAVARVSQEMLSKVYADAYGIDLVITRSFNHIGPEQKDLFVVPSFARQIAEIAKRGEKHGVLSTGDLSIVRDFLDVRDVVHAYWLLLQQGQAGRVYNVCSGKEVVLGSVIDQLADLADIDISTETNPAFLRPSDNRVIVGSNDRLRQETGWEPTFELRQSLQDIYEYWQKRVS